MRKLMNLNRKAAIVAAGGVAVVALSATAAFAYWTTSGTGSATVAAGSNTAVNVTQVGSVGGLVPGGAAQAVDFKLSNTLTTKQFVTSVSVAFPTNWSAQADSAKPACTAADFTLVQPNAINQDLAPGDTTFSPSGASIALKDLSTNQDNCKNVSVNLVLTAS